jgi:hypothetical protein
MDSARQILRWAIPGWLLPMFALGFVSVRFVLCGAVLTISSFAGGNYSSMLAFLTILAGLGVPIGYLVHQIYHWLYWRVPLPFGKHPDDRGYAVLKDSHTNWRRLVGYSVDADARFEKGRRIGIGRWQIYIKDRRVLERYEHNWRLATAAFYFIVQKNEEPVLATQVETLADIYHGLGATLVSLWLAFFLYLTYELSMHRQEVFTQWGFAIAAGVNLLLLLVATRALHFNRYATLRALIALMHDTVTAFECLLARPRRKARAVRTAKRKGATTPRHPRQPPVRKRVPDRT